MPGRYPWIYIDTTLFFGPVFLPEDGPVEVEEPVFVHYESILDDTKKKAPTQALLRQ